MNYEACSKGAAVYPWRNMFLWLLIATARDISMHVSFEM